MLRNFLASQLYKPYQLRYVLLVTLQQAAKSLTKEKDIEEPRP